MMHKGQKGAGVSTKTSTLMSLRGVNNAINLDRVIKVRCFHNIMQLNFRTVDSLTWQTDIYYIQRACIKKYNCDIRLMNIVKRLHINE